ncbi:accessory factor UbiK family protein [Sulfuriflexus sp.]|uniref:accessory factor UbiK family protein n=1 Tax=Sulfuriflexus sp. TaxID=2015443 RepID=UPI0028CF7599|nr:accessory factor UbiK family protein [Sulfuriflexus sp.]MDT8403183.1 accessory factor UbiK family protein [Sulfuriflexus sp.]
MNETRNLIDDLTRQLRESLPDGLATAREDFDETLRLAISAAVSRMDLVTREEFDVQAAVLARTREKLEALITRLQELENKT